MAVDWALLRSYARRQRDLVTRRQCLAAGMSARMVEWRLVSDRWVAAQDGVYLTRPGRDDWETVALAALLRADSGARAADAALCGRSAAYLWGLERTAPAGVQLVVPQRRTVVPPTGATVRRSMRWDDLVHDTAYPWRTTVPATVLEVATDGSATDALATVAKAVQRGLTTGPALLAEITARGGHRHSRILRPALADVEQGAESGAELLYLRDVERAHGLPRSRPQSPSSVDAPRRHDFGYEAFGVLVEVDGRLGHEQWADRVRDGRRDRSLLTVNRVTTRVFWPDVAVTPCASARDVARVLSERGWTGRPRVCRRRPCVVLQPPGRESLMG
jgi:hypothetical protein